MKSMKENQISELRKRDTAFLWHPYTEITSFEASQFPIIDRAQGCTLYEVSGRELLDGIASWWCVNLGHGHPRLVHAIQKQAQELQHVLLGGISHPRAIELAEQLAAIVPRGLGHAMFASDGSCAVEAALKIALQYWTNKGESGRTRFIALKDGYHGDSLGAVGAGYIDMFHKPFKSALQPALHAESPYCNRCPHNCKPESCDLPCFDSMARLIREHHRECAAVIIEPLCQAAAGMRIYPKAYLQRLRALCDEYQVLLIADEIAVGFGRTGMMFACQRAGIVPDIMTVGKGLTGGMLPMSATLVTDSIYDTFRAKGTQTRTFYHGHTFCGNPITSAVAVAAIDVYKEENVIQRLKESTALLEREMGRFAEMLDNSPVRTLGMISAVEIKDSAGGAARAKRIVARAYEAGLFIRPLGAVIYLWPPLTADLSTLKRMTDILLQSAQDTKEH